MTLSASAASGVAVFAILGGAVGGGCVNDVPIGIDHAGAGSDGAGSLNGGSAGTNGGASGGGAGGAACQVALCGSRSYLCGNCMDDDGDGSIDAADSQCLGPCDDTEDSYYPAIPGQDSGSCRLDCYYDPGSGTNDQCFSSFRCDPWSVGPDYPPSGDPQCAYDPTANVPGTNANCDDLHDAQSDACQQNCGPLVPNGCDCFGCCELPARSGNFVWIGSTVDGSGSCTEESVNDPAACRPCTPVPSCENRCEECEVCAGLQTPGEACSSGEQCPTGRAACGLVGQGPCPPAQYCITGCCVNEPR